MPKDISTNIRSVQDKYASEIKFLLCKEETFLSNDKMIEFVMIGGARLISCKIAQDFILPTNKEIIENDIKDGINTYIRTSRQRMKIIFQGIVNKCFAQGRPLR